MEEIKNVLNTIVEASKGLESLNKPLVFNYPHNPVTENIYCNLASAFYKRLKRCISEFDASLDQEHEIGVRLVNFGQTVIFHLESMGYCNPSLILFRGHTEDGNPVELVQHVSQISILLTKLPRKDPSAPKQPIGFASEIAQDKNPEG